MFVEDDLFDERAICEAIFKHSAEAILITDDQARIIHANPSVLNLFQYTFYELMMQNVSILIPESARKAHKGHVANYSKAPVHRSMNQGSTLFGRKKDSSLFPINASLSPTKLGDKKIIVALIIDMTEIHESKQQLNKLNQDLELKVEERTNELANLVSELEATNKQLKTEKDKTQVALVKEKELNDLQSRFVSMASHEFRTPLSTILSSVALLQKYDNIPDSDEKKTKHYNRISSNVKHLTSVLNDFLSLDKLQSCPEVIDLKEVNLKELLEDLISDFSGILKPYQEIRLNFIGNEVVYSNPEALKISVSNLISNASKYSNAGDNIELNAVNDKGLLIEVQDHGMGIPSEDEKHMFERFFRATNAVNIQGTGIGLTIVKRYIDLLGGTVTFESKLDTGTTFRLTIN